MNFRRWLLVLCYVLFLFLSYRWTLHVLTLGNFDVRIISIHREIVDESLLAVAQRPACVLRSLYSVHFVNYIDPNDRGSGVRLRITENPFMWLDLS